MHSGYFQHPRFEVTETRLRDLPGVGLQVAEIRVCACAIPPIGGTAAQGRVCVTEIDLSVTIGRSSCAHS